MYTIHINLFLRIFFLNSEKYELKSSRKRIKKFYNLMLIRENCTKYTRKSH